VDGEIWWKTLAITSPDSENRRGNPTHLHNRINYDIPYLPIPTHTYQNPEVKILQKELKKDLTRCSKKHCRPLENLVYRLRKRNIPFYEQIVPHKVYLP
jgi:hypothetical protein